MGYGILDLAAGAENIKELADISLTLVGGIAALIGAWFGLKRYASEQNWQRKQFAYDYAERIVQEPDVALALRMLDWASGKVTTADADRHGCTPFDWNVDMVAKALALHCVRPMGFTREEYMVRNVFDAMLEKFERLGAFLESKVLDTKDFPSTLRYYITLMNEPRIAPLNKVLSSYMKAYQFLRARWLFNELGAKGFADG